jgi:tetratricopeptide (TPR) repeat protein
MEMYQKAIQAHPTNGLVFNDLGLCYRRQRQLDKSTAAFAKAAGLVPDNAKYRNNYAAALVDAGRTKEAYEQLSEINSAAVAHFNLAYLLQQKGNRAEAIRHLQEAVSLDPSLTPAREMLVDFGVNSPVASAAVESPAPHVVAEQQASRTVAQVSQLPAGSYSAGVAEQRIYTSTPHVETPADSAESSTYHISDEAAPVVATSQRGSKQRTNWGSAAWAIPASDSPATRPLPPVE